jgi:hypothetical protein
VGRAARALTVTVSIAVNPSSEKTPASMRMSKYPIFVSQLH